MAVEIGHLSTHLTLLEGGRAEAQRRDEEKIEAIAFCDEVVTGTAVIVDLLIGLPVPSIAAMDAAYRLAERATKAKAQLLELAPRLTPEPAA